LPAAKTQNIENDISQEVTSLQAAKTRNIHEKISISVALIKELRSLGKPPPECQEVAAAVAYLLRGDAQFEKLDWKGAQTMMSNPTAFVKQLRAFDAKSVPQGSLKKAQTVLEHLTYKNMMGKSVAAASLLMWCHEVFEICSKSSSGTQEACEPPNTPAAVLSSESTAPADPEKKKDRDPLPAQDTAKAESKKKSGVKGDQGGCVCS